MDRDTQKWREKFHHESLDNEQWLTPKEETYLAFKQSIEQKRKKRKPKFIYWVLGLILFGVFYNLLPVNQDAAIQESVSDLDDEIYHKMDLKQETNQWVDQQKDELSEILTTSDKAVVKSASQQSIAKSSKTIRDKARMTYGTNTFTIETKNQALTTNSSEASFITQQNIGDQMKRRNAVRNSSFLSFSEDGKLDIITLAKVNRLLPLIWDKSYQVEINGQANATRSSLKKSLSIGAFAGFIHYRFNLNNHFNDALDPADFYFNQGNGFNTGINTYFNGGKKQSFEFSIAYASVDFLSGHNSSVNYDYANEADMSNSVNLVMASPIGFMESSMSVNRSVSSNAESLTINLETLHNIESLNMSIGLHQEWLKMGGFRFNVLGQIGANYILNISNDFVKANVEQQGFSTNNRMISLKQTNVRRFIPMAGLGLDINYALSPRLNLGLTGSYSSSLAAIYKEADFATTLEQLNVSLNLKKRLGQ